MTFHRLTFSLLFIFFVICNSTSASIKITGKVQNGLDGKPIYGAKVTLEEIGITTFTGKNGVFTLNIPPGSKLKITVKEIDSNQYIIKSLDSPEIALTVEKEHFKRLVTICQTK